MQDVLTNDAAPRKALFEGKYIYEVSYHEPFHNFAHQLIKKENDLLSVRDDLVGLVGQSRILPPVILYVGIGKERFSQLPGFFGNMLLHASEIEGAIASVATMLDIDWETYFARTIVALPYSSSDGVMEAHDASEVLRALPDALRTAKDIGTGLLGLTSWGAP